MNSLAQEEDLQAEAGEADLAEAGAPGLREPAHAEDRTVVEVTGAQPRAAWEADELSDATQLYLHQIGLNRLLTPEEELRFARRAAAGDFAARQKMIEHNLRLVVNVAKAYLNRGMPL
ncbi:MAG TPA: sigma-70 factor domain-containing protein, partial [Burkholderiales bacterium]|nr:sigma-70 factor domain-containing protein [Burkholderiales bacterium]